MIKKKKIRACKDIQFVIIEKKSFILNNFSAIFLRQIATLCDFNNNLKLELLLKTIKLCSFQIFLNNNKNNYKKF